MQEPRTIQVTSLIEIPFIEELLASYLQVENHNKFTNITEYWTATNSGIHYDISIISNAENVFNCTLAEALFSAVFYISITEHISNEVFTCYTLAPQHWFTVKALSIITLPDEINDLLNGKTK